MKKPVNFKNDLFVFCDTVCLNSGTQLADADFPKDEIGKGETQGSYWGDSVSLMKLLAGLLLVSPIEPQKGFSKGGKTVEACVCLQGIHRH